MRTFIPSEGPTRYSFKDPDTGYMYHAHTKQALMSRILAYREQNELEFIPNLSLVIDNYLCSLPENSGKCMEAKLRRSLMSYIKGGIALLMDVAYYKQVSKEEAGYRARQCIECPHNVFPDKDAYLVWADDIAERATGGKKSEYYDLLGNCAVCSCPLRAKVWYGGDVSLSAEEEKQMKEVNCWQLKLKKNKNGKQAK